MFRIPTNDILEDIDLYADNLSPITEVFLGAFWRGRGGGRMERFEWNRGKGWSMAMRLRQYYDTIGIDLSIWNELPRTTKDY